MATYVIHPAWAHFSLDLRLCALHSLPLKKGYSRWADPRRNGRRYAVCDYSIVHLGSPSFSLPDLTLDWVHLTS